MIRQFVFALLIIICVTITCDAQFYKYTTDDKYQHVVWDAIELEDNTLVIPDSQWDLKTMECNTHFYKFDPSGHLIDEVILTNNNYYYNLLWVEPIEDDLLFGGMAIDKISTNRDLLIIRTDTAFNIKWDTIFGSEDTDLMESLFVSSNDKFYVNSIQHTDTNGIFCIYQFNNTGLITASISKVYNGQFWSDLIESPSGDSLYISHQPEGGLWVINTDSFTIDTIIDDILPNYGESAACLANYSDSIFLQMVYSLKPGPPHIPPINQLVLLKRNLGGQIKDYNILNPSLDTSEMIYHGCLYPSSYDSIMVLSTRGHKIYGHAQFEYAQDTWFSLYSISSNGTINWNKLYGGNGFYRCTNLLPSKTGGYYLIGNYFDWRQNTWPEKQMVVYKVDRHGQLVLSSPRQPLEPLDISLFPNPVSNLLTLEFNELLYVQQIKVFDTQGRIMLKESIESRVSNYKIDTSGLKPGAYILQLITISEVNFNYRVIVTR